MRDICLLSRTIVLIEIEDVGNLFAFIVYLEALSSNFE